MVLSIFTKKKHSFALVLGYSGQSHVDSLFTNEEQKKKFSFDVFNTFQLMQALFMTLLIQTAVNKIAALTVFFLRLPNVGF